MRIQETVSDLILPTHRRCGRTSLSRLCRTHSVRIYSVTGTSVCWWCSDCNQNNRNACDENHICTKNKSRQPINKSARIQTVCLPLNRSILACVIHFSSKQLPILTRGSSRIHHPVPSRSSPRMHSSLTWLLKFPIALQIMHQPLFYGSQRNLLRLIPFLCETYLRA